MKIYATFKNSGIDQCCVIFQVLISVSTDYLYVFELWFYVLCKRRSLLTILHTQKEKKNDVDYVSGRPGFQIPTPSFLGLKCSCEIKATENN